jgi:HK97 family phage portal protein
MRWPWEKKDVSLDTMLRNIAMLSMTTSGISVTPENCMKSPTVHAIVTAVQNRLLISPLHVLQKAESKGRATKEELPGHPVARLLNRPNLWQTREEYIGDAVSSLIRHGRFHANIGRGSTGPIRELIPLQAGRVEVKQDEQWRVTFRFDSTDIPFSRMHYVRLGARNFYKGDSPVEDIAESIALEIAAEQFGAAFFGNGALPMVMFKLMEGFKDFNTEEEKDKFLRSFKEKFSGREKFSTGMLPKGMDFSTITIENDKAQFIETRRFIRTVIAGALGVPPHLVGDLERGTFNNVEQQDTDFTINVIMPIAKRFEAAMERDLLTDEDRRGGVIVRFNLDAVQRADIKTRSEALKIEREMGIINANDWREQTNRNPISEDDGGNDYIRPLNMAKPGDEVKPKVDARRDT